MFVIVKYAQGLKKSEKENVTLKASAHDTYTGRLLNIKPIYHDRTEAQDDCDRMNRDNICGRYDVCSVQL